jgi:YqaJ-like viral recombinase domain
VIIHNCEQGSLAWKRLRLGIPTASEFGRIITPGGKASTQADDYTNRLVAEFMLGEPIEGFEGNRWTQRGTEVESNAVAYYEFQTDRETQEVGFVIDDDRTVGCSPDRLVGEDGLAEIKCLAGNTHVERLLDQAIDPKYKPQIQGQLYVTQRQWVDAVFYHPRLPSLILRVERDVEFLSTLHVLLRRFRDDLAAKFARMRELGYLKEAATETWTESDMEEIAGLTVDGYF